MYHIQAEGFTGLENPIGSPRTSPFFSAFNFWARLSGQPPSCKKEGVALCMYTCPQIGHRKHPRWLRLVYQEHLSAFLFSFQNFS